MVSIVNGEKVSEFQERDQTSKQAPSGSHLYISPQFYKVFVLVYMPHPPSSF